ncbi:MAG: recombinase family protein, partial [Eubacteriales bacterium]|nr:recombinase family protein [Eubacteriales bacterium]
MTENTEKVWNTCGYVRLSREDGDKEESNSVTGQKDLIRDFMSRHPELRECGMKVDDGFTGSNFERPAFQEMLAEIKSGKINCIVVKDLSRFGREHLDA